MKTVITYWFNAVGEALRSALHSLWTHKLRAALTLLSIFIGVATIIILYSVISGLNHKIEGEFAQLGTSVLYVERHPWTSSGRDWHKWHNLPPITMAEVNAASRCAGASMVVPNINIRGTGRYKQNTMDIEITGTTWEMPFIQGMIDIEQGRFFSFGEDRLGRPVCVLGYEINKNLFEENDPIGQWVKLGNGSYQVVGVLKKQGQSMVIGSNDNEAFIPFNAFMHTYGRRRSLSIMVAAKNSQELDELREELRSAMRGIRKVKPGEDDNFAINSQDMLLDEYNKITRILWSAILAIAGLSLLVGGIGVMNIMLITVTERTREIGVRKALGATRTHILTQFLLEALTQCWLGGTLGFIAGVTVPYLISKVISQVPFALSLGAAAVAIGFTTLVGISFGLYPAMKAAKLSPVDALRYE